MRISSSGASGAVQAGELERRLGLVDAIAIFVGIILGSGIFVAPRYVAAAAPSLTGAVGLWLVGGLIALAGALCYAECGARLPRAGGFFVYYRAAFGDWVAAAAGWSAVLLTYPVSVAAIALVLAGYLGQLLPATSGHEARVAAVAILVAGILNGVGVRLGAWAQRLLTGAKVVALMLLSVAALVVAGGSGAAATVAVAATSGSPSPSPTEPAAALLLTAAIVMLWTYDGWSDITLVAGEIRDPGANLWRTAMIGVGIVFTMYAVVQVAVSTLLAPAVAASSERVLAEAVQAGLGAGAGSLVAAVVVLCAFGSLTAIVLTSSRLGFAMARDGLFPGWLGSIDPRLKTPARSIAALTAAALAYVAGGSFRELVGFFSGAVWIFYALTAVALLRLRRGGVGEPLGWRVPGGPAAPAVLLATAGWMTVKQLQQSPAMMLRLGGLLAVAGILAYGFTVRLRRSS